MQVGTCCATALELNSLARGFPLKEEMQKEQCLASSFIQLRMWLPVEGRNRHPRKQNPTGRKVSIISQSKALAAVCLCLCDNRGTTLNNKTKPAVRPAPEPHRQVPNALGNERGKSALHRSNIPLPDFQQFHSRSAFAAPFWALAKAAWVWQPGKDVIRIEDFGQLQYSVGHIPETFVFEVL